MTAENAKFGGCMEQTGGKKLNILMTTMQMGFGGAETHIYELSRALTRDGHRVTVASAGGKYAEMLEANGIRHVTLPLHTKNPVQVLRCYFGLKKLIQTEQFDVVHAHARIPAFICGKLQKKLHDKLRLKPKQRRRQLRQQVKQ